MAWKVKWTEAAWNDLEEAADYIAQDSAHYTFIAGKFSYSDTFVNELFHLSKTRSTVVTPTPFIEKNR